MMVVAAPDPLILSPRVTIQELFLKLTVICKRVHGKEYHAKEGCSTTCVPTGLTSVRARESCLFHPRF